MDKFDGIPTDLSQLQSPQRELEPGEEFHGRYVIESLLGRGSMGVAYAATDRRTDEKVVVKLINPALTSNAIIRNRLIQEGIRTRKIRHQNVVAMFDVGEAGSDLYLTMEYVKGPSLRQYIKRKHVSGEDVSLAAAVAIIRNVLLGVQAAHGQQIVHRDLKPENIVLVGNPDDGVYDVKILDFGISCAIQDGEQLPTSLLSSGTPLYMAPEQRTLANSAGPASDLFSLTVVFYELLIGVTPSGIGGPASKERNDLPGAIDKILEKGLASRPQNRYQTATEYLTALEGLVTNQTAQPAQPVTRKRGDDAQVIATGRNTERFYWGDPAMRELTRIVIDRVGIFIDRDDVHVGAQIPREKTIAAVNSYASKAGGSSILLLYDATLLGGGGSGLLLTDKAVYWQNFNDLHDAVLAKLADDR